MVLGAWSVHKYFMEVVLGKREASTLSSIISPRFEYLIMRPKEHGLFVQLMDRSKSIITEHFLEKSLFKSYTATGEYAFFAIPNTKLEIRGMSALRLTTRGAVMRMVWTSEEFSFERSIYLLDQDYVSIPFTPRRTLALPIALFSRILRLAERTLEVDVEESGATISSVPEKNRITVTSTVGVAPGDPCTFNLLKYHLDRLPRIQAYSTLALDLDANGVVRMTLEGLGVLTSISMSSEVVFFNEH
ncbi:hypothetical protein NEDG_00139 [Nematocida displodere]|uniref:Cell cycle checkpoint protein n=1 Tax=Nematocida displodere TaxID=1805483 RepID=A0A177EI58_9MICR|nr:hypothetical protein NEDG_00139 [Nematocida displodere]